MRSVFLSMVVASLLAAPALAEPIAVVSYDIHETAASGFGGWSHTYTGTITPLRNFTNGIGGPPGVIADYQGGSGTLNDGIFGSNPTEIQLFVQGVPDGIVKPVIILKLARVANIKSIKISGGEMDFNLFPGQITGVVVEIGGQPYAVNTIATGTVGFLGIGFDDIVPLEGSILEPIATDTIVLRDFIFPSFTANQFSISEIEVDGIPVPVPTLVAIDVEPGNRKNVVHLNGDDTLRVGILSSATFDATTIEPLGLTFGRTGNEASMFSCKSPVDINNDGLVDLLCIFSVESSQLQVGDTVAVLKGAAGPVAFEIIGSDTIEVRAHGPH